MKPEKNDDDDVVTSKTETEQYMEDIRCDMKRNFKKNIDNIFGSVKTISSDK
jgi:hypothetical protein